MFVVAVIVTFNPDPNGLNRLLDALGRQPCRVVVVDNGSSSPVAARLDPSLRERVDMLELGANLGIGAALNAGIAFARRTGARFVLLMDQDSVPQADMLSQLLADWGTLSGAGRRVALIGPRFMDRHSGRLSSHMRLGRLRILRVSCGAGEPVRADLVISSGSLISLDVLDRIGGMDEGLFIDHVDTEWTQRALSKGFEVFGSCRALMEHDIGEFRRRIWFFRWRDVPVHRPFRYYYVFRNSLLLYRRSYMPKKWLVADVARLFYYVGFAIFFHPHRLQSLRMMARGLRDGMKGIEGPMP